MINEQMKKYVAEMVNKNALVFGNKEEYLTWREEWKESYKTISMLIRKLKNKRKTKYGKESLALTKEDEKYIKDNISPYSWTEARLESAQGKINHMICELYAAREIHRNRVADAA